MHGAIITCSINGRISSVFDTLDLIRSVLIALLFHQLRKCKTDMYTGLEWDNPDRPECTNLLTIYQVRLNVTGYRTPIIDLCAQEGRLWTHPRLKKISTCWTS